MMDILMVKAIVNEEFSTTATPKMIGTEIEIRVSKSDNFEDSGSNNFYSLEGKHAVGEGGDETKSLLSFLVSIKITR